LAAFETLRLRSPGPSQFFEQTGGHPINEKRALALQELPDIAAVLLAVALDFIVNSAHCTQQRLPVIGCQDVQRWKHLSGRLSSHDCVEETFKSGRATRHLLLPSTGTEAVSRGSVKLSEILMLQLEHPNARAKADTLSEDDRAA
jgi:hypothetical protein